MNEKSKIGVIGCGNISDIYFPNCAKLDDIEIIACADLIPEKAKETAQKHKIPKVCLVDELLADKDISIILNLTVPVSHYDIAKRSLLAGKHIYNEKPLSTELDEGAELVDLARSKGLRVGCAPDTFMGAGIQTCRKLIDDGAIGKVTSFCGFMMCRGHEHWHPSPEFYYKKGGGPLFDMGPYYLTALINLLGPVKSAFAAGSKGLDERTIASKIKFGQKIKVEVNTHIIGILTFCSAAIGTLTTSFDVQAHSLPDLELYGTEGTLRVPDPNTFGGPVKMLQKQSREWKDVDLGFTYVDNSRGIGVADMACAIAENRKHRANGEVAFHVLEVMYALEESVCKGSEIKINSTCERSSPMPNDPVFGIIPQSVQK